MVCSLGFGSLRSQSCEHGMGAGEEGRPDCHFGTQEGASGELLCAQVAL